MAAEDVIPEHTSTTEIPTERTKGLGALTLSHGGAAFSPSPASMVTLDAVASQQARLSGVGLDWGCGSGMLAILASRIATVKHVIGLDLEPENVLAARHNAEVNAAAEATSFFVADSVVPTSPRDKEALNERVRSAGGLSFVLSNPPASLGGGDDGFGWRRRVLQDSAPFMKYGGVCLLQVSTQYSAARVAALERECPGWRVLGVAQSSPWVRFDLRRPDVLATLTAYAEQEARAAAVPAETAASDARFLPYELRRATLKPPAAGDAETARGEDGLLCADDTASWARESIVTATEALAEWEASEKSAADSPLTKWQVIVLEWRPQTATETATTPEP